MINELFSHGFTDLHGETQPFCDPERNEESFFLYEPYMPYMVNKKQLF